MDDATAHCARESCDFCDGAATYAYECRDPEQRAQWWVACHACALLLEARDLPGLINRAIETLPARIVRWNHVHVMREQLRATYTRVLATLAPQRQLLRPEPLDVAAASASPAHRNGWQGGG